MIREPNYPSIGWTAARLARHVELALGDVDISAAQYRLLNQLAQGDDASTTLAKKLAVSAPSITAVVDGLVHRGAIARTPSVEDRRRISLALTPEGVALLAEAEASVAERLEGLAAELDDAARATAALEALALWTEVLDTARSRRLALREVPVEAGQR